MRSLFHGVLISISAILSACGGGGDEPGSSLSVTSSAFLDGGKIPENYAGTYNWDTSQLSVDGTDYNGTVHANDSIPLSISKVPTSAVSLAIVMDDESDFGCATGVDACTHWSVYNIPASVTTIAQNQDFSLLSGAVVQKAYAGPRPPRLHTYKITVYALNINTVSAPQIMGSDNLTRLAFAQQYASNIVASATLSGTFDPANP